LKISDRAVVEYRTQTSKPKSQSDSQLPSINVHSRTKIT